LRAEGVDPDIIDAIVMHTRCLMAENGRRSFSTPGRGGDHNGLIVATALVYPDKKLSSVKPKSVVNA